MKTIERLAPGLFFLLAITITLLVLTGGRAHGEEVPVWVEQGILATETGSMLLPTGRIYYHDQRVGGAGERGPYQMTAAVFRELKIRGATFTALGRDMGLARRAACAHLLRLFARTGSWDAAVAAYNVGLHGDRARGRAYARKVRALGAARI